MVAAARKHKRAVQMGNQRRSWPWMIESIQRLHGGEIGEVLFARHLGIIISALHRAAVNRRWCRSGFLIILFLARPRAERPCKDNSSITTGIGSGIGAMANSATTAFTRSTSPVGDWADCPAVRRLWRRPIPLPGRPGNAWTPT